MEGKLALINETFARQTEEVEKNNARTKGLTLKKLQSLEREIQEEDWLRQQ